MKTINDKAESALHEEKERAIESIRLTFIDMREPQREEYYTWLHDL